MERNRKLYKYSGGMIDAFAPVADSVSIEDVARGLAYRGRWCGQTRKFYSVAEHSIMVACQCSNAYRLWGLLHDAGEAFFGDTPAPHKDLSWFHLPGPDGVIAKVPFVEAETGVLNLVLAMSGVPVVPVPAEVHEADMIIRAWEFRELVCVDTRGSSTFQPMGPEEALEKWLECWHALRAELLAVDSGQLIVDSEKRLAV